MFAEQRQRHILDSLESDHRVAVAELAERFGVAAETVRRDLDELQRRDLLVRVHGGAVVRRSAVLEPDLTSRHGTNPEIKKRIGEAAADFLPTDPETALLLDAGSSVSALVPRIGGRTGTVVTHSLDIAQAVLQLGGPQVHLLPGRLRPGTGAAVGAATVDAARMLRPDVAFLGCNGYDEESLYTPDPEEGAVKSAFAARAALRVVLADSSKARAHRLVAFAAIADVDVLVTDDGIPPDLREALVESGVEVVLA
ncbi:DeoR/GlpR family DNA-binding transcription regulator [Brachybacterium sp. DNPG3]